jgi:mycothiol synthase
MASIVQPTDEQIPLRTEIGRVARRILRSAGIVRHRLPTEPPKPAELHLVWPARLLASPPLYNVPERYALRHYSPADDFAFFELMRRAGFDGWNPLTFQPWLMKVLPAGFFFLVERSSGALVATSMACHNPTALHPFGATLSCVAVDPEHRGRGLGQVVSAAATRRLLEAGYTDIYMETDDWRLPAIKVYLVMGWVPFLFQSDMPGRWKLVLEKLGMPYSPESWRLS